MKFLKLICLAGIAALGVGATAGTSEAADYNVNTLSDSGAGSLRQAMLNANGSAGLDQIVFSGNLSGKIVLKSDLPDVTDPLRIVGPGPAKLTIDGAAKYRVFMLTAASAISGLRVLNAADAVAGAGAVAGADAGFRFSNTIFEGNKATPNGNGAAIYISSGAEVKVDNSTFKGNVAGDLGGAIHVGSGCSLQLTTSTFAENRSQSATGGAINADDDAVVSISSSTFESNQALSNGGAVAGLQNTKLTVSTSEFTGNSAKRGGAILGYAPSISDSTFEENVATAGNGGAIAAEINGTVVRDSTFVGNKALGGSGWGGAVSVANGSSTVESLTVVENSAAARGGGLDVGLQGSLTIKNSIISNNTSPEGPDLGGKATVSFSLLGNVDGATLVEPVAGSNLKGLGPQLGLLKDNGGSTRTMVPPSISPVVNRGKSTDAKDQRGATRPSDYKDVLWSPALGADGADIGAVELQSPGVIQFPPPPSPQDLATDPISPNVSTTPKIKGSAPFGTVVRVYETPDCSGMPVVQGSATKFASTGFEVMVSEDSITTFNATATNISGTSKCSTSSVEYIQTDQVPEPPPGTDPPSGTDPAPGTDPSQAPTALPPLKYPTRTDAVFDGKRLHVRLKCPRRFKPKCSSYSSPVTRKGKKGKPMARKQVRKKIKSNRWTKVSYVIKPAFRKKVMAMTRKNRKLLVVKQKIRSKRIRGKANKKRSTVFHVYRVRIAPNTERKSYAE